MNYPGKLIVLEGVDHRGKSTEAKRLKGAIEDALPHANVLITREPWGPLTNQALQAAREGIHDTAAKLMMVDRMNHIRFVIKPALERGDIVICDRYYPSTCIYQGQNINGATALYFEHHEESWFIEADLIILLTVQENVRLSRKRKEDARGGGELDAGQNLKQDLYLEFMAWLQDRGLQVMTVDTTEQKPSTSRVLGALSHNRAQMDS